jgi:raffinose/stachyose/melibiose transport system permease protein
MAIMDLNPATKASPNGGRSVQQAMKIKPHRKAFPTHIVVFLLPATFMITVLLIYPIFQTMWLSMFAAGSQGKQVFVGLKNIVTILTSPMWKPFFLNALKNNFVFWLIQAAFQDTIALTLAALLTLRVLRGRVIYRTILVLPAMLSVVIVGFMWQLILSPLWGVTPGLMNMIGLGRFFAPWLGLQSSALITLAFISAWQWMGMPMMLFYAALVGIPTELIEASIVDGATSWGTFWRIKLPLILPTVGMVFTLTFVSNFNAFDLVYTTQGPLAGPNYSTDLLGTLFYRTYFGAQLQMGDPQMGSALATLMFFITLAGVLVYMLGWRRRVATYDL